MVSPIFSLDKYRLQFAVLKLMFPSSVAFGTDFWKGDVWIKRFIPFRSLYVYTAHKIPCNFTLMF